MLRLFPQTLALLDKNARSLSEALRQWLTRDATTARPVPRKRPSPTEDTPRLARSLARSLARGLPPARVWWMLFGVIVSGLIAYELRTSALQAYLMTRYAAKLSFEIDTGPSPRIVFPTAGPYDQRLGNSSLPAFTRRLNTQGYRVVEQARMTQFMARLAQVGITPPYAEPAAAGLVVHAAQGETMFDGRRADWFFERFEDVPVLVVDSLLYIENRDLLTDGDPRRNPAVDWDRLAKAGLLYVGRQLGMELGSAGGSTLATQIEKFRHSPGGRTTSVSDKLRQMIAASLRVYEAGADTRAARRQIVVDYLNSMPLAAAPGYGEVHGLGEGLHAWFGLDLHEVRQALSAEDESQAKVAGFKHALALICAVRSPTRLLVEDRDALDARINSYIPLLERAGVISAGFGRSVLETPLRFAQSQVPRNAIPASKEVTAVRTQLLAMLGLPGLYEVDRLNLEAHSTIDLSLQQAVDQLFQQLREPEFLAAHGLRGERLMSHGDPHDVTYSLLLYEAAPQGNLVRVQTDSHQRPFDLNTGMKMELGSTAKLRTLAHYLEVVAGLYDEFRNPQSRDPAALADDPITQWAVRTIEREPSIDLEAFLQRALDRGYSASPGEVFFTGGGAHVFRNFDRGDNGLVLTVRTATVRSTNLVFIRLMRDLVRFHTARLPYDANALVSDTDHPLRRRMLEKIADEEATSTLERAYRNYRGLREAEVTLRLLRNRTTLRRRAVLFYAWHVGADQQAFARWLSAHAPGVTSAEVRKLARAYGSPQLTLADYGYLLGLHPLEIWCTGELLRTPGLSFEELNARAAEAKRVSSAWLFETRNRRAQDLRLKIQVERDAFDRMTAHWHRLGFPFERLIPSYATAIGSSSDRPAALAELMGIIVNDGKRRPAFLIERLSVAAGTPYHTVFGPDATLSEQVMRSSVARVLHDVLAEVVEEGTARRLKGALHSPDGSLITVGGKTGSGDNRYETFTRGGHLRSSRAVNRTAAFVFYIGDRYYGVITASVDGAGAQDYRFTSSLPLAVLRLLAPQIECRLNSSAACGFHAEPTWQVIGSSRRLPPGIARKTVWTGEENERHRTDVSSASTSRWSFKSRRVLGIFDANTAETPRRVEPASAELAIHIVQS